MKEANLERKHAVRRHLLAGKKECERGIKDGRIGFLMGHKREEKFDSFLRLCKAANLHQFIERRICLRSTCNVEAAMALPELERNVAKRQKSPPKPCRDFPRTCRCSRHSPLFPRK